MKQKIIAAISDIPTLDGYLHDASFTLSDITIDSTNSIFILQLRRIYYEGADRGKFLFVVPVVRYPHVLSLLTITNAQNIREEWKDSAFNGPDDSHTLLDIDLKENNHIEIRSEYLILHVEVSASSKLILEDLDEPDTKKIVTDFSKSIFQGMEEIYKLKRNAQQPNQGDGE